MFRVYSVLLYLLVPAVLARLALRGLRNRGYWQRWRERFGHVAPAGREGVIWVHAVSVGEVKAAVPLLRALQDHAPGGLLVTTMTPTGSEQLRQQLGDSVAHCYAPYDIPGAIERFLDRVKPAALVIMETEIWPNMIRLTHRRGIPVALANVRISRRSAGGYRRLRPLLRRVLAEVDAFAVQSDADAERLVEFGAPRERLTVTGSIKFEVRLPASLIEVADLTRSEWGRERRVWVAGSTREGEEELVLKAHARLAARDPSVLLVLVPRHPERFASVARLCRRRGFNVVRRTETDGALAPDTGVYLADTMGELPLFYAAADVAFVGGSLVETGGHNVLEPCALGVPVVFGPHMYNFVEISRMTLERGAGVQVADAAELADTVERFLHDANLRFRVGEAGRRMVEENRGSLRRTMDAIRPLLPEIANGED